MGKYIVEIDDKDKETALLYLKACAGNIRDLKYYSDSDKRDLESLERIIRALENSTSYNPIIKCQGCKYQIKEWREDKRMKEKGYWVYGCEHFGDMMGYWGFGGNDNEFCSDAEPQGGAE